MLFSDTSGGNAVDTGVVVLNQETQELEPVFQEAPPEADEPKTDEGEQEAKKRTGYQRKLDKKDAEIEALRLQLQTPKPTEKAVDAPTGKPKIDDFETYEEFYEAFTDWKFEDKLSKAEQAKKEESIRKERDSLNTSYKSKVEEFKKVTPDFQEAIDDYDGPWNGNIQQALLESDLGPQVSYYLAKNPDEADKLEGMNLIQTNKFIAKIEAKLESQTSDAPVVKTTKAPPPIRTIGNGSATSTKDPGDMTFAEYEIYERNRKRK